MTHYAERLLKAIGRGPIRAIGGIVYDANMDLLMSTTDLCEAIKEVYKETAVNIVRTDSGGSPTWNIDFL
jgi:hypothetical protein